MSEGPEKTSTTEVVGFIRANRISDLDPAERAALDAAADESFREAGLELDLYTDPQPES